MMIEINRKLYMDERTGSTVSGFTMIKKAIERTVIRLHAYVSNTRT